jgi:CubicO group peptidase (beta-lactamase class C family)
VKSNPPPLFATLILFLLIFQSALSVPNSQRGQAGVDLPSTPVGKVARTFFEALNRGEHQELVSFIQANYSEQSLRDTAPEVILAYFKRLYRQSGGLEVMQVSTDSNERFLVLDVRSKRGSHWARIFFALSGPPAEKLIEVGMFPVRDPKEERADAWPEAKMTEADAVNEIGQHVEREAMADRFSGVVLINKGGRIIFNKAYGMAEKSFRVPNRLDTRFNLGSMNKMFTSVAIAQLVAAGKLSFEDTLAKVLPDYPNKQVAEKVTIHQLLTHTSGLGDFFDNPEFRPHRERYQNPPDYFPLFASRPLYFEPGSRFSYSNAGFIVLGAIVAKVSGKNYFDYVREHIFRPAGMLDTDSYELTEVVPNLAVGYGRFEDDPMGIDPRRSNIAFLPWKGSPAGGGYSTAPDLLKFAQALRLHKLVNAQLTEFLTSPKTPMTGAPRPAKYAYGFAVEEVSGKEIRGHSGGGANSGINSDLEMFWDGSYTVIVMSNYDAPAAENLDHKICEFLARQ